MKSLVATLLTLAVAGSLAAAETRETASGAVAANSVELVDKPHAIDVRIGGELFTTLHHGDDLPKPFFAPVHAPGGAVITRPIHFNGDVPERFQAQLPPTTGKIDHPHQKGIFLATDEVNKVRFWAEAGKIATQSVEAKSGNPATIQYVNHWNDRDGRTHLVETTTISIHPNRLMEWDIRFTAGDKGVAFDDTKEGMFGIRLVDSMRGSVGGRIVNSDGLETEAQAWGKTADWTDYSGPVDGKTVGVALFDHPENFRKSRYHVRNYGLFSMSPFGESAYTNGKEEAKPVHLKAGETLRLRYGVHVHAGDEKEGKVAEAFQQFAR
ncbi:MAG: PmoA family protein [Planctomycetaceae bacterium]